MIAIGAAWGEAPMIMFCIEVRELGYRAGQRLFEAGCFACAYYCGYADGEAF